jgi:CHAT domain-containing protein
MERTRAAALVTVDVAVSDEVEAELATLRALHAELAEQRRAAGDESRHLLVRITAAEERIRRATWNATTADDAARAPATTAELRTLLDGAMLVEYGVLDDQVIAAVVEPRRVRLVEVGSASGAARHTDRLLFALRRLARPSSSAASGSAARQSAGAALSGLHEQLVRPLAIPPDVPLVVVPVGDLQRIPWAPLHDAATTVAPSASFWARTRRERGTAARSVALVAGPDLPGAVDEVDALAKVHPNADLLVPPDSSAAAVTSALRDVGLAHLACHGTVRADNPTFSSLLLSDGPLTVHELGMRAGAPHRIVLAACDSGVQVSYPGNEALGFVSALFARGTAGLVASTVLVPDLDALPLMQSLHEHIARGAPVADALCAARSGLDLDEPGQYVNWCAFNAYGAA